MNYVQKFLTSIVVSALLSATIVLNRRRILRFLNTPQRSQAIASLQKEYATELKNIEQRAIKLAIDFVENQRDYFLQMADEQKLSEDVKNEAIQGMVITARDAAYLQLEPYATRMYGMRLAVYDDKLANEQFDLLRKQVNNREKVFVHMREAKFPVDALIEQLWPTNPLKA